MKMSKHVVVKRYLPDISEKISVLSEELVGLITYQKPLVRINMVILTVDEILA